MFDVFTNVITLKVEYKTLYSKVLMRDATPAEIKRAIKLEKKLKKKGVELNRRGDLEARFRDKK